jgi:hypothetical protein
MHLRTITGFAALLALAACGGGSSQPEPAPVNTQGLWYQINPYAFSEFLLPYVLVQNGADIVVKHCDRSTSGWKLQGSTLLETNGAPANWHIAGDNAIIGKLGASGGAEWRRFSNSPVFDSGRVSFQGASLTPLQASQDVCAARASATYKDVNGTDISSAGIMITAPYQGSHVRIDLNFAPPRKSGVSLPAAYVPLSDYLRTGEFVVGDSTYFVQHLDSAAHVQVRSAAFTASKGRDSLTITGGKITVGVLANGAYTFNGSLTTDSDGPLAFSAELTLERRL